ncbi:tyrosine-type recombinase/integrase, partial [Sinorhodobacter sp. B57]|nr:tyrosine-type recombinase/integrase [Sedimentimonas flavescens]
MAQAHDPIAPPQAMAQPVAETVKLSEAVGIYLRLKGQGRPVTFQRAAERSCGYVIDVCGDRDITAYKKADANAFRDDLIKRKLAGSSITRIVGTVRAVINFAASEMGIDITNPFGNVYYDRSAGVEDRSPLPLDVIHALQSECRKIDDDLRWLVALVSDTGMRLAEAAGLLKEDLKLDAPIPHVVIREHPWRRLKTSSSARVVPLVGMSLWAARRIHESVDDSVFAFPRYNRDQQTNANSASAALNKWMKPNVPKKCTMHSFRHSMRDRLRAVECPADIVDQIGGWQTEGVGHSYGSGYPLEVLAKWMRHSC